MSGKSDKIDPISEWVAKWIFYELGGPKKGGKWFFVILAIFSILLVFAFVDLAPKVESEFFFSNDDPRLQTSQEISRLFPSSPKIIINASGDEVLSTQFLSKVCQLSDTLAGLKGIEQIISLTHGPKTPESVPKSELWRRLLLPDNNNKTTNLIISLNENDNNFNTGILISQIESAVTRFTAPNFKLAISGVPYVVEQIRRHLLKDLRIFSLASMVIFGLFTLFVFRSWQVSLGTLISCMTSCSITLALLYILRVPIGILTANIVTIVFALTLSHIVFLTSNAQRLLTSMPKRAKKARFQAIYETFCASFWCMLTTFFGFCSLIFAVANPLKELGISGAIGTIISIMVAYAVYPNFLASVPALSPTSQNRGIQFIKNYMNYHPGMGVFGICIMLLLATTGLAQINTDPSLFSYFKKGGEIHNGLEAVDSNGGSSPLNIVIRDSDGLRLDTYAVYYNLKQVQNTLEEIPDVGLVLSPAVIVEEGKLSPQAFIDSPKYILDVLESESFNQIALSFVTHEREQGLLSLRMREISRQTSREEIINKIIDQIKQADFIPELVGGLFLLQSEMAKLVINSIITGLGGLFLLFLVIALIVSRSLKVMFIMFIGLVAIPLFILGMLGHFSRPLDMIVSPSINIAIALGIDSMLHLVMRVRQLQSLKDQEQSNRNIWRQARLELLKPILGATVIISTGFGIFSLSSFPPTQSFGAAVVTGTFFSCLVALIVVPYGAMLEKKASPDFFLFTTFYYNRF